MNSRFDKFNILVGIFGIIFIFILSGVYVTRHSGEDKFYRNLDMKIVQWDYSCSTTNDKFHKPQLCNAILFERVINGDYIESLTLVLNHFEFILQQSGYIIIKLEILVILIIC